MDSTALDGISSVPGDLTITGNDALVDLSGLENISSLPGGRLSIEYNDALVSLTGLDALTSIGDDLYIRHNDALVDVSALHGLVEVLDNVIITDNASLLLADANALVSTIGSIGGSITVN